MSNKLNRLNINDPILQQFNKGLRNWECPSGISDKEEKIVTHRALRTVGKTHIRGAISLKPQKLSSNDPTLIAFKDGLEVWENPGGHSKIKS